MDIPPGVADAISAELAQFTQRHRTASRDPRRVGEILHAHLLVEHALREYIEAANPNLGTLTSARLTFDRLRQIYEGMVMFRIPWLDPGLKAINTLRNKLTHRLGYEITPQDLAPLTTIVAHLPLELQTPSSREPSLVCFMFAWIVTLTFSAVRAAHTAQRAAVAELQDAELQIRAVRIAAAELGRVAAGDAVDGA